MVNYNLVSVDFHKGRPGLAGNRGKDHWHHNGKKKHYFPGDEIEVGPVSCPAPATDPKRIRRPLGPLAEEYRMQELSHRQMEIFWTKILAGTAIAGAVYIAGPASIPPAFRWVWAY